VDTWTWGIHAWIASTYQKVPLLIFIQCVPLCISYETTHPFAGSAQLGPNAVCWTKEQTGSVCATSIPPCENACFTAVRTYLKVQCHLTVVPMHAWLQQPSKWRPAPAGGCRRPR
jgi:hypothetical protein